MLSRRRAFTLIELLVVIAIVGILIALLIPAVQMARAASSRMWCARQMSQLGLALAQYHNDHGSFPPGMVSESEYMANADSTGFTKVLPYLEQSNVYDLYNFSKPWYDVANYQAVAVPIGILYCPSNRRNGSLRLEQIAQDWGCDLPPTVAGTDYIFCKGANAALAKDPTTLPLATRGVFDVNSYVRMAELADGTGRTIAVGEGAGGDNSFLVDDWNAPGQPAKDLSTGQPVYVEQSWAAGSITNAGFPYYGSIFGVTAQRAVESAPGDEPMNPASRLVAPTVDGNTDTLDNSDLSDRVSGFRSLHPGGGNFLFCDGSVHFVGESIDAKVYRSLSTYADGFTQDDAF